MSTPWSHRYAFRTAKIKSSAIRELLKLTQKPEIISFAGGLPAGELFPVERFAEACQKTLKDNSQVALQYGPTEGYAPLREMIAQNLNRYGVAASPENVLLTSGSQQALDLIAKLLINRGDHILTEAPTYLGALQAFNVFGARYVTVPIDQDGIRTELLEEAVRTGPKFMYLLPNFQNPGGVTMSLERRKQLVKQSNLHGIPIIEDDPYGQLRFEGEHQPPLVLLDRQNMSNDPTYQLGNIIYLSTFSKTLAPGLRLGWIVAPPDVISKLVQLKQSADLHSSTFNQVVAYEVAKDGFIDEHVRTIRRVYRERRDVMLAAMQEFFPEEVTWTRPQGGLFLWVTLPEGMDCDRLFKAAVDQNVAFVPGYSFFPDEADGFRNFRLNFSSSKPDAIREGIRRLSVAIKIQMEETKHYRETVLA
jgi:2-aminoadipate transaminase